MIESSDKLTGSVKAAQTLKGNVKSGGSSNYELPVASKDTLGGIKVGENLTIDEEGRLNAIQPIQEIEVQGEEITLKDYKKATDFKLYGNSVQIDESTVYNTSYKIDDVGYYDTRSGKYMVTVSDVNEEVPIHNFFNMDKSGTINGVDYIVNDDGSITLNGTCTSLMTVIMFAQESSLDNNSLKPGYYTYSLEAPDGLINPTANIFEPCLSTNIMISSDKNYGFDKKYNYGYFTIPEDGGNITIGLIINQNTVFDNAVVRFHIKQCVIKAWLQEPLRKLGDVADYIDLVDNKIYQYIEVVNDSNELPIEERYRVLDTPIVKDIGMLDTVSIGELKDKTLGGTNFVKPTFYCKYDTIYKKSFKTINGQSIEGEGNIVIEGGSGGSSSLEIETITVPLEEGIGEDGKPVEDFIISIQKCGNFCILNFFGGYHIELESGKQLAVATIPEGYRPTKTFGGQVTMKRWDYNEYYSGAVVVTDNGIIKLEQWSGKAVVLSQVLGQFAYFTQE